MQPNNLTQLDFVDIRASIVAYLQTRPEFSDYEFEGSTLSYLIDILAYNTYYGGFTANMAMNEAFLQTATIRDNIVKHAKLLNYVPQSVTAARADLSVTVQTELFGGIYPSTVTFPRGLAYTGGGYVWNCTEAVTATVNPSTGIAEIPLLSVKEGSLINFSYTVNTFTTEKYEVPSPDADINTLKVTVKANESATQSDIYNRSDNITGLTATDRVYFIHEGEDQRFVIQFGDNTSGRALRDGEVVSLEYIIANADTPNDVQTFVYVGGLFDNLGRQVLASNIRSTVLQAAYGGQPAETVESIKYNAPRYYSAQYRAVTAEDYAIITKKVYDNANAVVAYGGDLLNPPQYGKVFISIRTKTGSTLNDATKKAISADLRKYAMASIDPVIVDPDEMFIYTKVFALYDTGCGDDPSTIKTQISDAIQSWGQQAGINAFNSSFRAQQYEKAIIAANKCVLDVSAQISILKYMKPDTGVTNSYTITVGQPLYDSAPSQTQSTAATKEPILLSGKFRTADRPGLDQQFEDDGYGNIVSFYDTGTKKVITNKSIGRVDYTTGTIVLGPINIIATGGNLPQEGATLITDAVTGAGSVLNESLLPTSLQIPVQIIPLNPAIIVAATPGTTLDIVAPDVTVQPNGTTPPPQIPLNSLTPTVFDQTETIINFNAVNNGGSLNS